MKRGLYAGLSAAFLRQWLYGSCRMGIFSQLLNSYVEENVEEKREHRAVPGVNVPCVLCVMCRALCVVRRVPCAVCRVPCAVCRIYVLTHVGLSFLLRYKTTHDGQSPPLHLKMGMGMTSGGIGSFVGCPSEVALVRMGADSRLPVDQRRNYKNVVDCVVRMFKEEGIKGPWRGAVVTVQRAMVRQHGENGERVERDAGGCYRGYESHAFMCRVQVWRVGEMNNGLTRICLTRSPHILWSHVSLLLPSPPPPAPASAPVPTLAPGWTPSLCFSLPCRVSPCLLQVMGSFQMGVYSETKERIAATGKLRSDGLPIMFSSAMVASFFANGACMPFDVVKSRIQSMPTPKAGEKPLYAGMIDCAKRSVAEEGPLVLWRGFTPAFIKLAPYTCLSLTFLEALSMQFFGQPAL